MVSQKKLKIRSQFYMLILKPEYWHQIEKPLFEKFKEVLQGDTLAPFLFIIVLDYAMMQVKLNNYKLGCELIPRKSRRHQSTILGMQMILHS